MNDFRTNFISLSIIVLLPVLAICQDTTLSVTPDGNIGIGTTNTAAKLEVSSGGNFSAPQVQISQTNVNDFTRLRFRNGSGNIWDIAESPGNQFRIFTATGGFDIMTMTADGKIGIRTPDPQQALHVNGSVQLDKTGADLGRLILNTVSQNDPGRYGILFSNNVLAPFLGEDIGDQNFGFYSVWSDVRTYDAMITIHGKANGNWGNALRLTHDGTDGYITTDTGNLILNPTDGAANVGIGTNKPAGKLDVNGTIYQRGGLLHADYVFEPGYQLESIDEHAQYM